MARTTRREGASHVIYRRRILKEEWECRKNPTWQCIDEGISASGQEIRMWIRGSVERHMMST